MKKNTKIIYVSEIALFIYTILLWLYIGRLSYNSRLYYSIAVLLFIFVILLTFFGFTKDKNYLRGSSARIVTASLMMFMLIVYGLGIILGFTRGYIYSGVFDFLRNVGPVFIIIIVKELLRFIIAKNCLKNKIPLIVFTFISSILSILLEINLGTLGTSEEIFIFSTTMALPIIAEEILCSYMTYKISMLPSLIYMLTIRLYVYVIPILPNLGNYMYSICDIVLPFILYCILNKTVVRYEKEKQQLANINRVVFTIPLTAFLLLVILLISGIFKYKLIAIMSDSMSPVYSRGDAVVYEKIDAKDLKIGDILAFQKDDMIITHRIVEIWKKNGKYYFATKGDNNDVIDDFKTSENNVLGRVQYILKYVGYPTVLVRDFFRKE